MKCCKTITKSVSDLDVDVSAATDKGECDGDVTDCDDVIGGG